MSFGNCLFDDRFVTAFRCRYVGIYKGIPYEGRMTKADGNRNGGKEMFRFNYMNFRWNSGR